MTSPRQLIATSEAAKILDVTPSMISRMVTSGYLRPAMRLPGRRGAMMFRRSAIEKRRSERAARAADAERAAS